MPTVDAGQLQITAQSETQKLNNLLDEHFAEEMARYPIYATFVGEFFMPFLPTFCSQKSSYAGWEVRSYLQLRRLLQILSGRDL